MIRSLSISPLSPLLTVLILSLALTACGVSSSPAPAGTEDSDGVDLHYEHLGEGLIRFTALFDPDVLEFSKERGLDKVFCHRTIDFGKRGRQVTPFFATGDGATQVLQVHYRFALPNDYGARKISLVRDRSRYLWGRFDLFPSNPRSMSQMRSRELPPIRRDEEIYGSYRRYPGELVRMGDTIARGGVGIVRLFTYPVQYYPRSERIEVYTKIVFEIRCEEGFDYRGIILRSKHATEQRIAREEREIRDFVINPEDVSVVPFEWSEERQEYVRCAP